MCSVAFASIQKDHNTESPFWWGYFVRRHLMARWAVMTGRSEFSMALGAGLWWLVAASCQAIWVWIKKKKIRPLACSSMKWLWIAMMCITAGWMSCQPGLDWCSEGHAVQGRCEISVGPPLLGGTEKTLWKAVLSGQIKTTVTFDVLRGWGNLSGLGSFSAFCCVIYYLGRKVWIIFLSFFFFF